MISITLNIDTRFWLHILGTFGIINVIRLHIKDNMQYQVGRVGANSMQRNVVVNRSICARRNDEDETPGMIVDLVSAALDSDFASVRRLGSVLVSRVTTGDSGQWHRELDNVFRGHGPTRVMPTELPTDSKSRTALLEEMPWPTEPLFLESDDEAILARFVAEAGMADRLAAAGLATHRNLILTGPTDPES
jgi:hypothetical protein